MLGLKLNHVRKRGQWRYQAITWTNVYLSSIWLWDIRLRPISRDVRNMSIFICPPYLTSANELRAISKFQTPISEIQYLRGSTDMFTIQNVLMDIETGPWFLHLLKAHNSMLCSIGTKHVNRPFHGKPIDNDTDW